jgi:hypothetical protein
MSDYSNLAHLPILLLYLFFRYLNQPAQPEQRTSSKVPPCSVQFYQNGQRIDGSLFLHCLYLLQLETQVQIDADSITEAALNRYAEMRNQRENFSVAKTDSVIASESYLKDLLEHVSHLN